MYKHLTNNRNVFSAKMLHLVDKLLYFKLNYLIIKYTYVIKTILITVKTQQRSCNCTIYFKTFLQFYLKCI